MPVRIKILLSFFTLTLLTVFAVYVFSQLILLNNYAKLDEEAALVNTERAAVALDNRITAMSVSNRDWAFWDDTYNFMVNVNPAYVEDNLGDMVFANLGLNFMLFVDTTGQIVYSKAFDLNNNTEVDLPEGLAAYLYPGSPLLKSSDDNRQTTGIISLPIGPLLVASTPILNSAQQGPNRGNLIWGCFLNESVIKGIEDTTKLSVTVWQINSPEFPDDIIAAVDLLKAQIPFTQNLTDTTLGSYLMIADINEQPALILRIEQTRNMYLQGSAIINYYLLVVVVTSTLIGLVIYLLVGNVIVKRLSRISSQVHSAASGDINLSHALSEYGNDEIALLAKNITATFNKLEIANKRALDLQSYLQLQINHMPIGLITWDKDFRVQTWNPTATTIFGFTAEEMVGKQPYNLIIPEHLRPVVSRVWERLLFGVQTANSINDNITKDGRVIVCEWSNTPLRDDNGIVIGALSMVQDITERRRAEKKLEESESKFRTFTEKGPVGIFIVDDIGHYIEVNPRACEISGYTYRELTTMSISDFIAPEFKDKGQEIFSLLQQKGEIESEILAKKKDGALIWISLNGIKISEDRYMAFCIDITERQKIEQEIRRVASFPEYNPMPIIEINFEGTLTYQNPAAERLFPKMIESCTKDPICASVLATTSYLPQLDNPLVSLDVIYNDKVYEINALYHRNSNRIRAYIVDITQHREMLALESQAQAANLANKSKSEFLASMSHELRTPLNAIVGFSQVLKEQYFGVLNEKQNEYLDDILSSGQHLLSLINDILDLSKVESGKVELELSSVNLSELVTRSLAIIQEKARSHNIKLDIDLPNDLKKLKIKADERRLKQVMFNLLSNASKFTPDGGKIDVSMLINNGEIIISVTDTGIGIAPEYHQKIFGGFFQISNKLVDKTPGTGLGLSLTKSIIELHGGRVWVESEGRDKGSKFSFSLPLQQKKKSEVK